jgi:tetratricopeptide (TPR) repeat protein
MPADREPIPADIQRAVLVEAGHRCAVCGESCPLERAHIVPWSVVKSHCVENLICLCANCHERADKEKWGQKTLEYYKKHPWVMRRTLPDGDIIERCAVTLRINDLDLPHFDARARRLFIHSIAGFLGISPESIEIVEAEDGSVIVTVELAETEARRLLEAIEANDETLTQILKMFAQPSSEATARERALQLCDRAAKLRDAGDYDTACDFFLSALELIRVVNDPKMEANICCNTGNAFDGMGMSRRAIRYHSRALEIEQGLGDEDAVAFHLANLGASYYNLRDFDEARKLFLRAQEMYRRLKSTERDSFINWYLERL